MNTKRSGGGHSGMHIAFLAVLLTAAACSSDAPDATAPLPTQGPTTEAPPSSDTADTPVSTEDIIEQSTASTEPSARDTAASSSTDAATTTAEPGRIRRLPDDLGPMVDAIPYDDVPGLPVPGEIIEIADMSYLYIPDTIDTSDLSDRDVRPPADDDLEIIAAYGRAFAALRSQTDAFPVEVEPNEEVRAAFVDAGQAYSNGAFRSRHEEGTYVAFAFDRPDVYRPYVLAEPRSETEAVIWDCSYISSVLVTADGEIAFDGAVPYSRSGAQVTMRQIDGVWLVDTIVTQDLACE